MTEETVLRTSSASLTPHTVPGRVAPSPASQTLPGTQLLVTALCRGWQGSRKATEPLLSPRLSPVRSGGCHSSTGLAAAVLPHPYLEELGCPDRCCKRGDCSEVAWRSNAGTLLERTTTPCSLTGGTDGSNNTGGSALAPPGCVLSSADGGGLWVGVSCPLLTSLPAQVTRQCGSLWHEMQMLCWWLNWPSNYHSLALKWFHRSAWLYFERNNWLMLIIARLG